MNFKRKTLIAAVLFGFAALSLLSGCGLERDRSDKPSEDWSRGLLLGSTDVRQPVALELDAARRAHLAWRETTPEDEERIRYARIDERGQAQHNGLLAIDLPNPSRPQLLVDGEDGIHLAWLSRAEGHRRLYHVEIDEAGRSTTPLLLSRPGENVEQFQIYLATGSQVSFVWEGQVEPGASGVYLTTLNRTPGESASAARLLVPEGIDPTVRVDNQGTIHVAWLVETALSARELYYATLKGTRLVPEGGLKVSDFQFAESALYYGPLIGLDTNTVYLLWAVQNTGGGFAPTAARAFYVAFEPGKPAFAHPRSIALPNASRPEYADHAGAYGYQQLVPLSSQVYGGDFNNAPATVSTQRDELPVVYSLMLIPRGSIAEESEHPAMEFEDPVDVTSSQMELGMLVLSDGEPVGYQLASDTPSASVLSTLVADGKANLHLAWIDTAGFRRYDVYYATNAPQAKEWLNRTTFQDVILDAADAMWGIASAIALVPVALIWNLAPVIWVFGFYLLSGQESLERAGSKIGLGVAFLLYALSKLMMLPGLSAGVPFFYRSPGIAAGVAAIVVPLVILLLALVATVIHARRSERATLFKAYLVFALVDGLLTVMLYAPGFFDRS